MKALFKHSNGRLKTSRMAFLVFLLLLVCLSLTYKMGKSADKVLLKIEHVFEAQKQEDKIKEPAVRVVEKKPVPIKAEKPVVKKVEKPVLKPVQKSDAETKHKLPEESNSVKKPETKAAPEPDTNNTPAANQAFKKVQDNKFRTPEKIQVEFTMVQNLKADLDEESMQTKRKKPKTLKLPSKKYFEIYRQWQEQGKTLDKEKALVNLRILNLENVYDLFQMKAVVIKDGVPHTDLGDNSRIANASLSEFSSTCFIVSKPWNKWGHALRDAGFIKDDNIEVWYYTYEFVRNSIYARAQKAFEWSTAKLNLLEDSDPSKADVLGKVYAVNKADGGAFGVFVPLKVDSQSHESVKINPLVCFKGEKDIQALNNAGLLKN